MDYCKIEEKLEFSRISINYFSLPLDHLVIIIEVISDTVLTQCRESSEEGGTKGTKKEEIGRTTTYLKISLHVVAETPPRSCFKSFGYRPIGLSAHHAKHTPGSCRREGSTALMCALVSLQRLSSAYIFPTSSHHIPTPSSASINSCGTEHVCLEDVFLSAFSLSFAKTHHLLISIQMKHNIQPLFNLMSKLF